MSWETFAQKTIWKPIEKWFINALESRDSMSLDGFAIIFGNSGCGKSTQFQWLCKHYGIDIINVEGLNTKDIIDFLKKNYTSNLIGSLQGVRPSVFVIEDMDTLCSMDRMFSSSLYGFLQTTGHRYIPMVAIANTSYEKNFGDLRRNATIFHLPCISVGDMYLYIEKNAEGLNIPEDVLLEIAKNSRGSFNQAREGIRMQLSGKTDEVTSFETIMQYPTFHNIREWIYDDTYGTILRFHENLFHEISARKGKIIDKKNVYASVLLELLLLDISLVNFELDEIRIGPLIYKWMMICKTYPRMKESTEYEFTRLLSRLSLHKKHARRMHIQIHQSKISPFCWKHAPYFYASIFSNKISKS